MVDWNTFWPDIDIKDIIKDFFVRFAVIPKQKNGVLYLKTIEEILSDRTNAVDWSGKLTKTSHSIDFSTRYAQENYFDYSNGENDPSLGRGILEISNTTLEPIGTIFDSVFESVVTGLYDANYNSARIGVYDTDSTTIADFVSSPPITLLTLRSPGADPDITFYITARSDYKVAYFVDDSQPKDSSFEYFINQFYSKYALALQKTKVIVKEYLLTELDIKNYDSHKMIYDGEGYYLVNKISNFIPGNITKVELFKVI